MNEEAEQEDFNGPSMNPENNLEATMLVTNPVWGSSDEVNNEFISRITETKKGIMYDENGQPHLVAEKNDIWQQLQMFTRDLRLGNLSTSEVKYCDFYLKLGGDFLNDNYFNAFIVCMNRVASKIELSQSHKGFFRNIMKTLTREHHEKIENVKKGGIFHQPINKM